MDDLDYCITLWIALYFHFCRCDHVNFLFMLGNFIMPSFVPSHS
jgi:hypothetical protein